MMCNILRLLYGVLRVCNRFCCLPFMPMPGARVKCITKYTREVSLACECIHEVQLSVYS